LAGKTTTGKRKTQHAIDEKKKQKYWIKKWERDRKRKKIIRLPLLHQWLIIRRS